MDQITQQNAASAEETASASEELSAQAQNMKEQVEMLSLHVGVKDSKKLDADQNGTHLGGPAENVKQIANDE
jgi:methyl-accepting chemotaxis protein